jgi:hypothetical protein
MPCVFSMIYIHKFQPKIDIPWQLQHKLYYFYFCRIFYKKKLYVENLEISIKIAIFEPTTYTTK